MIPISKVNLLPMWCINNPYPAFYDVDSATAVEQTAKLYGAMRELQETYNKFATEINTTITDFINKSNIDQEQFEKQITKQIHDYMDYLDTKIAAQNKTIDESIVYIKENLETAVRDIITNMQEAGELDEAIADSFNNMGTRVVALETSVENLQNEVETKNEETKTEIYNRIDELEGTDEEMNSRITILEGKVSYSSYDETEKKLTLFLN